MKHLLSIMAFLAVSLIGGAAELKWVDASQFPLIGKGTQDTTYRYGRLPDSLENKSRKELWNLGRDSAGLAIRFRSNSTTIAVKWESWLNFSMNHMTPTGVRGLDLYCLQNDSSWIFVNSARPGSKPSNRATIIKDMDPVDREYMLYLPLYDSVTSLVIGVDSTAVVSSPQSVLPQCAAPIVWYGTSILQGGCASRPGMGGTNIISRKLNREIINLGFSGNARLDYEIAHLMASIPSPLYILDFVSNTKSARINEAIIPFYEIIRAEHPETPILFVEQPLFSTMKFSNAVREDIISRNRALKANFDKIRQAGDRNVHYVSSKGMIGFDDEATVDGCHFTDLGFLRFSDFMLPIIQGYLE